MRWMKIPGDVQVSDLITEQPIGSFAFKTFAMGLLGDPTYFGVDHEAICSCVELRKLLRGATPGDVVPMDEEDWKRLCGAALKPSKPLNPVVASQSMSFFDAIKNAASEKPAE